MLQDLELFTEEEREAWVAAEEALSAAKGNGFNSTSVNRSHLLPVQGTTSQRLSLPFLFLQG